jgi:transcriptional regulator with XRE-family HTH domain
MDLTLGARLRQQREERQVTLTTISAKTKIKVSLLAALEQDDVSVWPKGLFGRAYLRDYAAAIGLDPEALVGEFLALHPEFAYVAPQAEEAEAAARAEAARRGAAEKFRRFVSSAFSVRPAPGPIASGFPAIAKNRSRYGEPHPVEHEVVSSSMPHVLAEAQEFLAPLAELEAREVSETASVAERASANEPARHLARQPESGDISMSAVADLCSLLARAIDWREVTVLLGDAARLLDAVGLIVWQWDPRATVLRPSLFCGYSESVIARLPDVHADDPNAVATAFRSGERCIVDGDTGTEAVVVPSMGVEGCVGVLAVELRPGSRQRDAICAFTSILAAQLAMLLPTPEPVEA